MQHLLLLHGAVGASDQLVPLKERLETEFNVHVLNFSGHGGRSFGAESFSIETFAAEVTDFLQESGLEKPHIFGYSMGGYVAMYLARHFPDRVGKVVTLATKYYWDEATATREMKMLDADIIEKKVPAFAAALKQRHHPNDWHEVLERTKAMLGELGRRPALAESDYAAIENEVLLLLGDKDKMVTTDETFTVYRALPHAALGMLPHTQHPIEQANIDALTFLIKQFLQR